MKGCYCFLTLFLLFLMLSLFLVQCSGYGPSWMQPGAYAEYKFNSTEIAFTNHTLMQFKNDSLAAFRWECISVTGQMATVNISINFDGEEVFNAFEMVQVNLTNQAVSLLNGTVVGVTFLWGPINIVDGQPVTLWADTSGKVEGNVTITGFCSTPQGSQKVYLLKANGTALGKDGYVNRLYDLDTGVFAIEDFFNDVMFYVLGLEYLGIQGYLFFNDTNIDLGKSELPQILHNQSSPTIKLEILLVASIIIFLILFLLVRGVHNSFFNVFWLMYCCG